MARQPMTAGRLRDRVRIERPVETKAPGGQPVKSWEALAEAYACVEPQTGRETFGGSLGVRASADELVTVWYRADLAAALDATCRVVVTSQAGRVLQVTGVERDPQRKWLVVPCKSAGAKVTP